MQNILVNVVRCKSQNKKCAFVFTKAKILLYEHLFETFFVWNRLLNIKYVWKFKNFSFYKIEVFCSKFSENMTAVDNVYNLCIAYTYRPRASLIARISEIAYVFGVARQCNLLTHLKRKYVKIVFFHYLNAFFQMFHMRLLTLIMYFHSIKTKV